MIITQKSLMTTKNIKVIWKRLIFLVHYMEKFLKTIKMKNMFKSLKIK
jgi:hypothetical protein